MKSMEFYIPLIKQSDLADQQPGRTTDPRTEHGPYISAQLYHGTDC